MAISKETQEILKRTLKLEGSNTVAEAQDIAFELENIIENATLKEVKNLSCPYVLLVSDEDKAVQVACYIHCTVRYYGTFLQYPYSGDVIKPKGLYDFTHFIMAAKTKRTLDGYTFFMRDVNVADCTETKQAINYFEELQANNRLRDLEKIKTASLRDMVKYTSSGITIHTNTKIDNIPEYFIKEFEVINLEAGNKGTPQQIKLLRGKKEYYAKPDEFKSFLLDIIKKYKNITLDKKANMAISQMEGRKLFLNDKGKPIYKKSTIKKMLSELNNTKKTKGKS